MNADDIIEWFNSEKGKTFIKEYFERFNAEQKAKKDFFETPAFNKLFDEIVAMLQNNGIVDSESILYFPHEYDISHKEYMNVFNAVFANHTPIYDKNAQFPTEIVLYKGVRFIVIHGQGSICTVELVSQN